ncbi:GMP/IMP nucleotidase [Magnetovirga frankeli]|uniref:GMP/IMP nucleotidase n=1 Tax=Magnetovirga frankeli TaxID=947516 RepID=UPI001293C4E6|nr:GMP/IMP nucleotidase [gamma proteobacterium SS-5]
MTTSLIDWSAVDCVLLDMDGTLLDLHFDNHFWLEFVPQRYAEAKGLPLEQARAELMARYEDVLGTLEWYCIDSWSQKLGLDIALLKEEVSHLIAVHPHVVDFLEGLGRLGKRVLLVTNAHQKALQLKMERTRLAGYFDAIISSHDLGHAKEEQAFWQRLRQVEPFDPARTLFVDDSLPVLRSAREYGIRWLLAILAPDSRLPQRQVEEFPAVRDFAGLLPEKVEG